MTEEQNTKDKESGFIEKLRAIFVPIDIFNLRISPLEKIVYGMVSLILLAVIGALVALVIKK